MSTQHTDLPWNFSNFTMFNNMLIIEDAESCIVALVGNAFLNGVNRQQANAEFIVNSCNHHDALVKALRDLLTLAREEIGGVQSYAGEAVVEQAAAALAKAGEQA